MEKATIDFLMSQFPEIVGSREPLNRHVTEFFLRTGETIVISGREEEMNPNTEQIRDLVSGRIEVAKEERNKFI